MKMIARNAFTFVAPILLAAVVAVPAPRLRAQSTIQSSAATPPAEVVDQLLSTVEREFVPLAEAMPADKYNFAPSNGNFKGVRTFAEQVKHVTQVNYYLFGEAASIHPEHIPTMKDLKTKAQIMQALKDSLVFGRRAIATLNAQNALEKVKPVHGIDTRAGIMVFAIIHMNDHFGQMVEYARMSGIVPPSSRHHGK